MEEVFMDTILPGRQMWCVLNNLDKFNNRPEYIDTLFSEFHKLKDHYILGSFTNVIAAVENYYLDNNKFPDMATLKLEFKDIRAIVINNDEFSIQIYDSLLRYIKQEIIREKIKVKISDPENPAIEDIRELAQEMVKFADNSVTMEETTKAKLLNMYEDYVSNFRGISTHINPIDQVIKSLGYQSLSVIAAPSGHGKSTLAFSIAYYAAITGSCVDYLSFEIPENHAWFNMASIESEGNEHKLRAMDMKAALLKEDEREYFKENMASMLARIKEAGGFLNIIDQTSASADTYEGLCAMLETIAEKRKRPADLIIIDNVDNLVTLKSKEKNETTKVNNMIISLDGFSKKYYNGTGAAILLLSQVNRPAMKKLSTSAKEEEHKTRIDVTCIQQYNALYEKATCVLVGYADESARSSGLMRIYPVKLRNAPVPEDPIQVSVNYAFSKVKGDFHMNKEVYDTSKKVGERAQALFTGSADFKANDIEDPKKPMISEEDIKAAESIIDELED